MVDQVRPDIEPDDAIRRQTAIQIRSRDQDVQAGGHPVVAVSGRGLYGTQNRHARA
jgi:hypothetical protein